MTGPSMAKDVPRPRSSDPSAQCRSLRRQKKDRLRDGKISKEKEEKGMRYTGRGAHVGGRPRKQRTPRPPSQIETKKWGRLTAHRGLTVPRAHTPEVHAHEILAGGRLGVDVCLEGLDLAQGATDPVGMHAHPSRKGGGRGVRRSGLQRCPREDRAAHDT